METNALYKKLCDSVYMNTKAQECQVLLDKVYAELGLDEKKILELLKLGYKQKEIATKLRVSRYRVQYILRKIKVKYHEIRENKAFD